jgi:hypothetical protein
MSIESRCRALNAAKLFADAVIECFLAGGYNLPGAVRQADENV